MESNKEKDDDKQDNRDKSKNKQYAQHSSILPSLSPSSLSFPENIVAEVQEDEDSISSSNSSFDDKRLISIDVLSVDKQSRITLTKKAKKIIPLEPGDNITICQDKYNSKNIILKVQKHQNNQLLQHQENNEIENWTLIIKKGDNDDCSPPPLSNKKNKTNLSSNDIDTSITYKKEVLDNTREKSQQQQQQTPTLQSSSSSSDGYDTYSHYNKNTLYNTPILLVDDNSDLLSSFNMILKDEGYKKVKPFLNSKSLLKHLFDLKSFLHYKMVILDIRMPDVNGIQLYQILKILNPSIKSIFITALDSVDMLTSMYPDIKSIDILKKPFDRKKFVQTVNDKVSTLQLLYGIAIVAVAVAAVLVGIVQSL